MIQGYIQGLDRVSKSRLEINAELKGNFLAATVPNVNGVRSRISHSTVVYGDYIYVFGGIDNTSSTAAVRRLDTIAGTWSNMRNIPEVGVNEIAAVICNNVIYVAPFNGIFYKYDHASNNYEQITTIPQPGTIAIGMFSYKNKIYYIGYTGGNCSCYDPETDTWTAKAKMPNTRYRCVCEIVNGRAYVIGGYAAVNQKHNAAYDPEADSWDSTPTNSPVAFSAAASWVEGDTIYILYEGDKLMSYNTLTDIWTQYPDAFPIFANTAPGAKIVGDFLYIIGGMNAAGNAIAATHKFYKPSIVAELEGITSFEFDKDVFLNENRRIANTLHNINASEGDVLKIIEPGTTGYIEYNGTIKLKS